MRWFTILYVLEHARYIAREPNNRLLSVAGMHNFKPNQHQHKFCGLYFTSHLFITTTLRVSDCSHRPAESRMVMNFWDNDWGSRVARCQNTTSSSGTLHNLKTSGRLNDIRFEISAVLDIKPNTHLRWWFKHAWINFSWVILWVQDLCAFSDIQLLYVQCWSRLFGERWLECISHLCHSRMTHPNSDNTQSSIWCSWVIQLVQL